MQGGLGRTWERVGAGERAESRGLGIARGKRRVIYSFLIAVGLFLQSQSAFAQSFGAYRDTSEVKQYAWLALLRSLNASISYGPNIYEGVSSPLETDPFFSGQWQFLVRYYRDLLPKKLSFYIGAGLSRQSFRWSQDSLYLSFVNEDRTQFASVRSLGMIHEEGIPLRPLVYPSEVKHSTFFTTQLNFPIMLEYYPFPSGNRSFGIGIGAYLQWVVRMSSHITYAREDRTRSVILRRIYAVNRWQYGVEALLSYRSFFVSYRHALHAYFASQQGPSDAFRVHTLSIGVSIRPWQRDP